MAEGGGLRHNVYLDDKQFERLITTLAAPDSSAKLDQVLALLQTIKTQGDKIMAGIDDVIQAATDEKTVVDSVKALLEQLNQLLKEALASNDPAKVQAALDLINANRQALADAVVANTPAA